MGSNGSTKVRQSVGSRKVPTEGMLEMPESRMACTDLQESEILRIDAWLKQIRNTDDESPGSTTPVRSILGRQPLICSSARFTSWRTTRIRLKGEFPKLPISPRTIPVMPATNKRNSRGSSPPRQLPERWAPRVTHKKGVDDQLVATVLNPRAACPSQVVCLSCLPSVYVKHWQKYTRVNRGWQGWGKAL